MNTNPMSTTGTFTSDTTSDDDQPVTLDAGWIDPRLGGLLAFMAAGVGVLFLPLIVCSIAVSVLLLATVVLFSVGDARSRRAFEAWVPVPGRSQRQAELVSPIGDRRQSAARLDPACESCRQRAATVLVQLDGQVFRVCAECAPQPVEGFGGAA